MATKDLTNNNAVWGGIAVDAVLTVGLGAYVVAALKERDKKIAELELQIKTMQENDKSKSFKKRLDNIEESMMDLEKTNRKIVQGTQTRTDDIEERLDEIERRVRKTNPEKSKRSKKSKKSSNKEKKHIKKENKEEADSDNALEELFG